MSTPFMGEMRLASFNFAPTGWALCDGQPMMINQNQALFSILSTMYGGDGNTYFLLPNCQGRVPIGESTQFPQGQSGGEEFHTLVMAEMSLHSHSVNAQPSAANSGNPTNNFISGITSGSFTNQFTNLTPLSPAAVSNTGAGQPHENRQPYLVLNMIICLQGSFPNQN